ncbi:MAG TPA: AraC family transcriptional regulator [Patescibacteria group bacterium]|nr:AraC family transcriptional regulator [Patescibacteria group bacterium]
MIASTDSKRRIFCEQRLWPQKPLEHVHRYAQLILPVKGALKISVEDAFCSTLRTELAFVPPRSAHTFHSLEEGEFIVFDMLESWPLQWENVKGFTQWIDPRWSALRTLLGHELQSVPGGSPQLERLGDYALHLLQLDEPPSIRYLHDHFTAGVDVPLLAELEHFSVGHYHKWFVKMTGTTPVSYVQQLRLERTRELLGATELPVRHIAWEVGYSSPASLSRLFLAEYGISPSAYRRSVREMAKK